MVKDTPNSQDQWSKWVLKNCVDQNPEANQALQEAVLGKVTRHAKISEGDVVLDVGTGAGLIGFGALRLVGEQGKVIFNDISLELLNHCKATAHQAGALDRCEFRLASASDLSSVPDASVDVVTLKAVLIYVAEKSKTFYEFYRVLKPGGRLYVEEPINRFGGPEPDTQFWGYDVSPIQHLVKRVREIYHRIQPWDTDPMMNFDERDLIQFARNVGFKKIDLELHAGIERENDAGIKIGWDSMWLGRGNPRIPCLEEAVTEALSLDEAQQFVSYLRPKVESETRMAQSARAFLWATK